ncbi:MAG: protein-export rane protein SecD [Herbinix sp.]|jgi:protein-export SecD/SecF family membrane protein|nr:protein-export rane protein SecD [Herbinix sp.]
MKKKFTFFIVLAIAILMVYTAVFGIKIGDSTIPGAPEIRFGTDIRGGVEASFQPEGLDRKPTKDELEAAREVIELRLDNINIMDRDVTIDTEGGYVIVRFPWKSGETEFNPEDAIAELGETAQLTFQNSEGTVLMEGSHVTNAKPAKDQNNRYVVALTFDEQGTKIFSDATKNMIGKTISIFMDETNIQTATVQSHIDSGEAQITGMNSYDEAKALADKINSGALPFSMVTKNYSSISPTLGTGSLNIMLQAGGIAFIIICALLIFYYRIPGFVACIALTIQVAGQILSISIPQMTLTLSGMAGIILSMGMGVDANVISSERISEEIKSGKSVASAISAGFSSSFASVFDGNVTVLIVSFVLMIFGSGSMLSFAYSLFTGIVFNFVAGVAASRLMIFSLSSYKFLCKPKLYSCFSRRITL